MTPTNFMLASEVLPVPQQFVMTTKLHPLLVNFTAALVPVSVSVSVSVMLDAAARFLKMNRFVMLPGGRYFTLRSLRLSPRLPAGFSGCPTTTE